MAAKKRHKRNKARNLFDLEALFEGVREALIHDLSDAHMAKACKLRDRGASVMVNRNCPPYTFKRFKQVLEFDKRVIWANDKSFDDLAEEGFAGFRSAQKTFCCPEPMSRQATLVIQRAREKCHKILGYFSYDDWFDSCSFGKRSAKDLPYKESYLDIRLERLSGTAKMWAAFNECLSRDVHLLRAVRKRCRRKKLTDTLKAAAVPKSFKSARIMFPDSTLGGFLSRGLGLYVRERLEKETHIDLSIQQERHRRWARNASITGQYSTIDMSKASDSFVWRHIELITPIDWHAAFDAVGSPCCEVGGVKVDLNSYMLMGSGHTFPLQTLLFFCLAEAVRTLMKVRGKVSVYGDDIIIPTQCAPTFIRVMSELGFTINSNKSFFDSPDPDMPSYTFFRESCGGDYKGGVDVRPYMPECDLQSSRKVPAQSYAAWCHKLINGLLDRWDLVELPSTVNYLLRMLTTSCQAVCFVPAFEVDHAGIRHYIPKSMLIGYPCSYTRYERSYPHYWKLVYTQPIRQRGKEERPYVWYSYWLRRCYNVCAGHYDDPISLTGESRRDRDGSYRWKESGRRNGAA
jgi:hypothetical protein